MQSHISILGLGYIGLPTAAFLASLNREVVGVDINQDVISQLLKNKVHIKEPGLEELLTVAIESGHLRFAQMPEPSDIYIICVPTPLVEKSRLPEPDMSFVMSAAESICPLLKSGDLVVLESTSPVGSTERIGDYFSAARPDLEGVLLAYCPERVVPGRTIVELVENDRIVGGIDQASTSAAAAFYRSFVKGNVYETDSKTAELCKLAENSFRDVNVAFANELSLICESNGIDVQSLIQLANRHPRVSILSPGAGVGGHCIAIDPWFIVSGNPEEARLIKTARQVNDLKPSWVVDRLLEAVNSLDNVTVGCLGLAFKPDIDDLRGSPALQVFTELKAKGVKVVPVEPNLDSRSEYNLASVDEVIDIVDIVAILVAHKEFSDPSFTRRLDGKLVLDFCGVTYQMS